MSLVHYITDFARATPKLFINGGEFERKGMLEWTDKYGDNYKASNVSRRLREMSDGKTREKTLEGRVINGSVWYKYIPLMERVKLDKPPEQVKSEPKITQPSLIP